LAAPGPINKSLSGRISLQTPRSDPRGQRLHAGFVELRGEDEAAMFLCLNKGSAAALRHPVDYSEYASTFSRAMKNFRGASFVVVDIDTRL
jgi:hypothetical protein